MSKNPDAQQARPGNHQTWHANGRQASLSAPHGSTYSFSWDSADRLQAIMIPGEGTIQYTDYQWHHPTTVRFPGGSTRTQSFDGLGRHQSIQLKSPSEHTLMDYEYTWDDTGNITEKVTEHGDYQYAYDDIDRLTEADYPRFSAEEWTYDPLGNRMTDTKTGEAEWQYNQNNELLSSVDYSYEYDANGSLIAEYHPDGSVFRTHEYNAETRLTAIRDGQGNLIAEYRYDPFGRRISKTTYSPPGQNPETTWYLYSDQGLMAELDGQGNQLDFYLFPPDGLWSTDPILRKTGSTYYYYQTDHLGTPQQLIDRLGNVVHSREMKAFGETTETGIEDRLRFPGQLHSPETGLYYNYFRDYAPGLGRYVQSDPIGLPGGANIYLYAGGIPLIYTDPRGLNPGHDNPFDGLPPSPFPDLDFLCRFFPRCRDEIDLVEIVRTAYAENECELRCSARCTAEFVLGEAASNAVLEGLRRRVQRAALSTARTWVLRGAPVVGAVSTGTSGGVAVNCIVNCWRI